jgi:hypothetical protein
MKRFLLISLMLGAARLLKWKFNSEHSEIWHRVNSNNKQDFVAGFPVNTGIETFKTAKYIIK